MLQRNRNQIILYGGILLFCGVVFYAYFTLMLVPVRRDIAQARATIQDLDQRLSVARARAQQLTKIQQEMASLQVEVAGLEKQLPKSRELPSLLRVLTHRIETFGLTLGGIVPGRQLSKGLYDEIPYSVTFTTSFHALGRFLTAMGKGERLFATRSLSLTAAQVKDPAKTVNAQFTLVTFKYHE